MQASTCTNSASETRTFMPDQVMIGMPARVAYLTNAYPKVSHSFIRREIRALEQQGFEILRISIRPGDANLPEAEDRAEADRTVTMLNGRWLPFLTATLAQAIRRPIRFLKACAFAATTGVRSEAGLFKSMVYLVEACFLVRLLAAHGLRHVHVHFGTNPATVAMLAHQLAAITFSVTLHGPDEFDAPKALHIREKVASASFVVAISNFGLAQLMRWSDPEDWRKIKVIRCGVDQRLLQSSANDQANVGIWSNTLVCIARLSAQKGLNLLLRAVARLAHDHEFTVRIIGDGELRAELEKDIRTLGLEQHVVLLGWRGVDDVRKEILAARAMVLPSLAEGLPVVLMEALALGRPVVTTCIAGIPELVDEACGCLVAAGSDAALAQAIEEILTASPPRLAQMGAIGRERVIRSHNVDRNTSTLAALLRPLV
ncbi:glycosyltransferase family 4 protein [Sphingomonas sp. C3-2]|uniref:glycosyltransferase family 4 protein n=1 Tax=Sphingomonas sp. C3-2 TaxID=3062169 RepID=UPI00294AC120|nr:glycosyltransferase family 4 protein [Sphingomonas sp. C3-2]WOK36600.1 glycosyltransferase family 4 protein [Sphingomonas sp. C3-2]